MVALGRATEQVKSGVKVEQEVLRVAGLRPNDIWTLDGVTTEEDGEVEAHNVVVAFFGVELDREATRIAAFIWKFTTQCYFSW